MQGFKQFLMRGNVVDMAVGVVVGVAFGAVVAALVKDLITPLIAAIEGSQTSRRLSLQSTAASSPSTILLTPWSRFS